MTAPNDTVTNTPEGNGRRKLVRFTILGVIVLALLGWGLNKYLYSRHHVSTDNAQVDGHVTIIAPRVSSFVSRVLVDDNQHVEEGDTLLVLDNRDLEVRLAQAEADLRTAEAAAGSGGRAGQAAAQYQASRSQASASTAAVEAAEATYAKTQADLKRYRDLAAKQIIAAQQLDQAEAAARSAAANLDAAKRQAAAAQSQVSGMSAGMRAADARLQAAQAAVDNAKLQLGYAVITAPQAGIVARRNVDPGALVQVGQALMAVVPDQDVWVTANLKETQLNHIVVGDSAEFTVDAYPGRDFHGIVESLSPATGATFALLPPDNATGNFTKVVQRVPVRIAVAESEQDGPPLRPGMSVEVTITTQ